MTYREITKLRNELVAEGFGPKDIVNIIVEETTVDRKDKVLWNAMFSMFSPHEFFDEETTVEVI